MFVYNVYRPIYVCFFGIYILPVLLETAKWIPFMVIVMEATQRHVIELTEFLLIITSDEDKCNECVPLVASCYIFQIVYPP